MDLWEWLSKPENQKTSAFIGGGLVVLVTAGWTVFTYFSDKKAPSSQSVIISDNGGIAAGGNVTATANRGRTAVIAAGDVKIGITLEEHHAFLRQRENELKAEFVKAQQQEKRILGKQLDEVRKELTNVKESYERRIASLQERIVELGRLKGQFPDEVLAAAQAALSRGDTSKADALFRKIEERLETPIKQGAEAAYQRGRIARLRLEFPIAYSKAQRATQLQPENPKYHVFAGEMANTLARHEKAIEHHERALRLYRSIYGDRSVQVAGQLINLGIVWFNKGYYDKAIDYYQEGLKLDIANFGEVHRDVARDYNNLGNAWKNKGEYDRAISFHEKALKIDTAIFGEKHTAVTRDWNNLGVAWRNKGDPDKAIKYFEKALQADLALVGDKHPTVAMRWNNLGLAYFDKGKFDKALRYHELALESDLALYGENHPEVTAIWTNLGKVWAKKRDFKQAIHYFSKAQTVDIVMLGERHNRVASNWSNLGTAAFDQGNYDKAIEYHEKALQINLASLGENHPEVAIIQHNLGVSLRNKGLHDKAISYLEKALRVFEQRLGNEHPQTRTTRSSLQKTRATLAARPKS